MRCRKRKKKAVVRKGGLERLNSYKSEWERERERKREEERGRERERERERKRDRERERDEGEDVLACGIFFPLYFMILST